MDTSRHSGGECIFDMPACIEACPKKGSKRKSGANTQRRGRGRNCPCPAQTGARPMRIPEGGGSLSCTTRAPSTGAPMVAVLALRGLRPRPAGGTNAHSAAYGEGCAAERGATGRSATRSTTHRCGRRAVRAPFAAGRGYGAPGAHEVRAADGLAASGGLNIRGRFFFFPQNPFATLRAA